jgi:pterin-4a-carbinolamine dehydratase
MIGSLTSREGAEDVSTGKRVFVSYRRDDAAAEAGRLSDALRLQLGEDAVFMDTSSIGAGAPWPDALRTALDLANTVVLVVGPEWVRVADEWGRRRIDQEDDWVRQEVANSLAHAKQLVPVLVRGARMPPESALPDNIRMLPQRQYVEIRRDFWDHDIKLLLAQLLHSSSERAAEERRLGPYPRNPPPGLPDPLDDTVLERVLAADLIHWRKVVTPLPENPREERVEIVRVYEFPTFQAAVRFMVQVAPGCDIALHHPRWENIWRTLTVFLTTWDIGHRISDRDLQLARYFDRAYAELVDAARSTEG